jgi:thiol-disulfide isomerase/thioredoxin
MWNGTLELPEVAIPLRMELDLANRTGSFIVGTEKTPIPEIVSNGKELTLGFTEYGAEISVVWDGKHLTGNYLRIRTEGTKSFRVSAYPGVAASQPAANAPTGNFLVVFEDETPEKATTTASIWKEGDVYYGTFIAPDGDYGLLEGAPTAQGIQFSRFTGWQAIAIEVNPDGENWSGRYHAASIEKPRPFKLHPQQVSGIAEGKRTAMKDPNGSFAFACTSLTGETVRHTDDRFKGKALAVDIMGTWCHNCMDESPVLEDLYKTYGRDGFQVVGLSYEIKNDVELGKKNLTLFRDRYKLSYPLLYCGSLDDANLDQQLHSQLANFFAFPTTLFIDRKGKVRSIHSGFQGPGTGDRYPLQVKKLRDLVEQVVR